MSEDVPNCVKVKRDGPRGWHWISKDSYDPDVHELYEGDDRPPSHKLNVAQLKEALTEKGIEFPEDAKKADLAKLLDEAPAE